MSKNGGMAAYGRQRMVMLLRVRVLVMYSVAESSCDDHAWVIGESCVVARAAVMQGHGNAQHGRRLRRALHTFNFAKTLGLISTRMPCAIKSRDGPTMPQISPSPTCAGHKLVRR